MPRTTISDPATPRAFPLLWGGTASANLADGIMLAIAPLLAATFTREPALVAGLVVAQRLPWFLFVLFAGVIVDRFDRRMLLWLGNALRVVAVGGVMLAVIAGMRELWPLYIAAFLIGTAETIVDNASLAILPQLIRRERIPDANGRIFATQSILNELVGPPLGALIFSLSAVAAFASGSAAFLIAAIVYFLLPRQVRSETPSAVATQSVWKSVGEGFRIFVKTPILIVMACSAAVINFCTSGTGAVFVLFAQDRLGLDDTGYGVLIAAAAVGGIPAGLLGPGIIRKLGEGPVWIGSTLAAGLGFAWAATTTSPIVVGIVWAVTNFGFTLGNIIAISVRQTAIPNDMLGRVTSVYRLLAVGVMPLGALVGGLIASRFGLPAPFWVAGAGMVLLAIATAPYVRTARIRAITRGADDPTPDAPPVAGASSE